MKGNAADRAATFEDRWSDELRAATRRMIDTLDILPLGDGVAFKHIDGRRYGAIALDDFVAGRLRIVERRSGMETTFPDADALVAAGWAID